MKTTYCRTSFFPCTVEEAVSRIQHGDDSCSACIDRCLGAIAASQDDHAFLSVFEKDARDRAAKLDTLSEKEKTTKPLLGIPVAVKDTICTKNTPTTCGSRMLEHFISPYNAAVVEALIEAGAVVVGKTNCDEFAMGSSTESSFFGGTANPHDPNRVPGGSSGGSAAAVARGAVPLALGSDTGGSIRQPAGYCGIAGLKPTYGLVSRYGLVAFASSLDQIGPMGSDVRDCGYLLCVIAKPDPRDATNAGRHFTCEPSCENGSLAGLRIGVPWEYFDEGLSDDLRMQVVHAMDILRDHGASMVDVSLPHLSYAVATYYIICTAEASSNLARYDGVKYGLRNESGKSLEDMYVTTRSEGFGAEVKRRIMLGTYVLSSGYYDAFYLKAAKVRTLIARDFETALQSCDCIISPTSPTPAFQKGEKSTNPLEMYLTDIYTVSANLAGIPALSVPSPDTVENGLPVGIQFMAAKWNENILLKTGYALQEAGQRA